MAKPNKERLEAVALYLDEASPIMLTAWETRDLIAAASDEHKREVFEHALIRLRDALRAWVAEGFRLYLPVVKKPALATRHLRQYLKPRLGHQLPQQEVPEDDVPLMPSWFDATEPAHSVIVWWTAEASAGEGDQIFGFDAEPAHAVGKADAALAQFWAPPPWLWRSRDFNSRYDVTHPKAHSHDSVRRELAHLQFEVWEAIESVIAAEELRAQAMGIGLAKAKAPGKRGNVQYQQIYYAVKKVGALFEGRAKLSKEFLQKICTALQLNAVPVPKQWKVPTWSDALQSRKGRLKAYIEQAVARHAKSIEQR